MHYVCTLTRTSYQRLRLIVGMVVVQCALLLMLTGHGIEHEFQQLQDKQLPTHSCVLCLTGQHVGDGLVGMPPLLPPPLAAFAPTVFRVLPLPVVALPEPRQGSPPLV